MPSWWLTVVRTEPTLLRLVSFILEWFCCVVMKCLSFKVNGSCFCVSFMVIWFQHRTVINGCLSVGFDCLSDSECCVLWFVLLWTNPSLLTSFRISLFFSCNFCFLSEIPPFGLRYKDDIFFRTICSIYEINFFLEVKSNILCLIGLSSNRSVYLLFVLFCFVFFPFRCRFHLLDRHISRNWHFLYFLNLFITVFFALRSQILSIYCRNSETVEQWKHRIGLEEEFKIAENFDFVSVLAFKNFHGRETVCVCSYCCHITALKRLKSFKFLSLLLLLW